MQNCEKINIINISISFYIKLIEQILMIKSQLWGNTRSDSNRICMTWLLTGKIPLGNRAAGFRARPGRSLGDAAAIQPACCINSSHGKPFQFLACSCTSSFCAASRPRVPGYTLCKQLAAPGAESFCVVMTQVDRDVVPSVVQPEEVSLSNRSSFR